MTLHTAAATCFPVDFRLLPNVPEIVWPGAEGTPYMTLIAGMVCDDGSILLAADSQLSEDDGIRTTGNVKIGRLDTAPLAWGCSGDESIGRDWGAWFRSQPPTWPSWGALRDAAAGELSRLNGRRRSLNRLAGVDTKTDEVATVLLVGFVGGQPDLIELSDRGGAMPSGHHGFAAIGSAHPHFKIALAALRMGYRPKQMPMTLNTMLMAVGVGIQTSGRDCSFPVFVVAITPTGAKEPQRVDASFE